jgi:hypothetical protein
MVLGPDAPQMIYNRTYIRTFGSTSERDDIVRHAEVERGELWRPGRKKRLSRVTTRARKQMTALQSRLLGLPLLRLSTILVHRDNID